MNRYETIFIVDADTPADDQKSIFERIEALISQKDGTLLVFDDWGVKKMAYEIRNKKQGHYVRLDYCGSGELVGDIERVFRHEHRILRFMTVRLEVNVDPEALKAAQTESVEEPAAEEPAAEEPATSESATAEAAETTSDVEETEMASTESKDEE